MPKPIPIPKMIRSKKGRSSGNNHVNPANPNPKAIPVIQTAATMSSTVRVNAAHEN